MQYYFSVYDSPVGELVLRSTGDALTELTFPRAKYFGTEFVETDVEKPDLPVLQETRAWLDVYFSGKAPGAVPHLRLEGSAFRKRVWEILLTIPYGGLMTYGDIAKILEQETGRRQSAQAVGGAVGHNPVSILVPCHRVIGKDGSLTGYAGGLWRKQKLLQLEHPECPERFRIPEEPIEE